MTIKLTELAQAQKDNADAIDAADADINKLLTQLGQTDPADQAEVDRITAAIQAKTAALIAATSQTGPV